MSEQRSDRFEAHATVDRLCRQGVAQPVGVHVVDPGDRADTCDDAVHGAAVDGLVVIGEQPASSADGFGVGGGPVGEEIDDVGV